MTFNSFDREHMEFTVTPLDLELFEIEAEGDTYTQAYINGASYTTDIGAPMLPSLILFLAVPDTDVSLDAHVHDVHYQEVDRLFPLQPPRPDNADLYEPDVFHIETAYYESDSYYPQETVVISESGTIREVDFIRLAVTPVRYQPSTSTIEVASSITVEVTWDEVVHQEVIGQRDGLYGFGRIHESYFIDWDLYSQTFLIDEGSRNGPTSDALLSTPDTGGCEYLIITNYTFLDAANDLKEWKTERGFITM